MSNTTRRQSFVAPDVAGANRLRSTLAAGIQFVGFWLAVILPFAYLPLLYADLAWAGSGFFGLLAVNLLALLVGHDYNRH